MKLSPQITQGLNEQISMEAEASYFYLSFGSWCEVHGYEGAANFFYDQSEEEREHLLKIAHYMDRTGVGIDFKGIKEPQKEIDSLETIIKTSLRNEQEVTKSIHELVALTEKEADRTTFDFLQWFVKEQFEEEQTFDTILQKFDVIGREKLAVYEIDKYMGNLADSKNHSAN